MISLMPMLQTDKDAATGAGRNGGRRPTVVAAPVLGVTRIIGSPAPPDLHRAGQAAHPGRDRSRRGDRWDRRHPASRRALLLGAHRLAQATRCRSLQRPGSRQARTEDRRTRSAGSGTGPGSARQCPSHAAPEACRSHHRAPKKSCGAAGHPAGPERRRALTDAVVALAPDSGMTAAACAALGVSRASVQRRRARLDRAAGDPPPKAETGPGADRSATAGGARSAARAALRRSGAGRDLRHLAR